MNHLFVVITVVSVMLLSCKDDPDKKSDPPDAPVFVTKTDSSDLSEYEIMGIDAQDGVSNRIRILWEEHPQRRELDYFNIYRSEDEDSTKNYFPAGRVDPDGIFLDGKLYHEFTDGIGIVLNTRYCYFVTAVNQEGTESENSDTVSYQLVEKARLLSPLGENFTIPDTIKFKWEFTEGEVPSGYILRIEDDFTDELVYAEWVELDLDYHIRFPVHPLGGDTIQDLFLSNVQYRWRIDYKWAHRMTIGSESNWGTFIINWGK